VATDLLIHWICTATSHRRTSELGLTHHEGQWAMCPELIGDGHEWFDTGGVDVSDALARWEEVVAASAPQGTAAA